LPIKLFTISKYFYVSFNWLVVRGYMYKQHTCRIWKLEQNLLIMTTGFETYIIFIYKFHIYGGLSSLTLILAFLLKDY